MRSLTLLLLTACGTKPTPPIDPALAARIPAGAIAVLGVNVESLRASPLNGKLPIELPAGSKTAIAAFDGAAFSIITEATAPTHTAPPPILDHVPPGAAKKTLWLVALGSGTLPLEGNLANINRFLHYTTYTTLTADISDRAIIEAQAVCPTSAQADQFEQSVRAFLSLAEAAKAREPLLRSIHITRDSNTVRLTLDAPAKNLF